MARVVVDASAAFRLLESGSPVVADALRRNRCRAPELIRLEVANALATGARAGRIDLARAQRLRELFDSLPIEIVPSEPLVDVALRVAVELGMSVYDAVYLVLARRDRAVLLTADRRLAALAQRAALV